MTSKPWYKSKVVWINILTIGGAVVSGIIGLMPSLELLIPPTAYAISIFALGVVNVILRTLTTGPIKWTDDDTEQD